MFCKSLQFMKTSFTPSVIIRVVKIYFFIIYFISRETANAFVILLRVSRQQMASGEVK